MGAMWARDRDRSRDQIKFGPNTTAKFDEVICKQKKEIKIIFSNELECVVGIKTVKMLLMCKVGNQVAV
jgi:hypothetical protein